ncbi:MAG: carbon-nitrogen hydrolase family protein [Gemmatimonadaceae bacterium]|nr:carbon-nitrogen hydrolase family protein [Gloeobacterales cyanobacterium ES-bin-141]
MEKYLAAVVQMTSTPDLDTNLQQAYDLASLAVRRGASLVCLPENFAFLGSETDKLNQAAEIAAASEKFLRAAAREWQVTVLGGGYPVPVDAQVPVRAVYNTALLVGPDGKDLGRYRKLHLFDVDLPDGNTYRESDSVRPGELAPVVEAGMLGRIGLSVCYDLRFPELYRALAAQGAEILLVPSAFTAFTGKDHWRVLLQARAIENTCYVLAPAQTGQHYERRQTYGHALIVDPWGTVLADAGDACGVAIAEIDAARVEQVRRQLPVLRHRRL